MEPITYLDFELEIEAARDDGLYPVSILRSPGGEATSTLDATNLLTGFHVGAPPATQNDARNLGSQLFEALFQRDILSRWDVSKQLAATQGAGLRLRLRLTPAEITVLPWELLFDARVDEFISLSRSTPLVRYLPLGSPPEPLTVKPPLRILAVVAAPTDLPPVDAVRERERLTQAVQRLSRSRGVELVWLEGDTWRHLQEAMQQGPWHIFHYVGHARLNGVSGSGEIVLSGDSGVSSPIPADQLSGLLQDQRDLRLVVLNACEGARSAEAQPFSSLAASLVQAGLPAVVAMQYEITAQAATEFTRSFYGALASSLPVDAAVAEARKAMNLAAPASVEWATPILLLRAPDGQLWEQEKTRDRTRLIAVGTGAALLLCLGIAALTWFVLIPRFFPSQMKGDFNIAVAGIGVIQPGGSMAHSEFGDALSLSMFDQLDKAYRNAEESNALTGNVVTWHDSLGRSTKNVRFGTIEGGSAEERTANAAKLADRIDADMVIYGFLDSKSDRGDKLQLEFYNAAPVRAGEPDATAGNQLVGDPITTTVPFLENPTLARTQTRNPVALRARALFWITQGIAYQLADEHSESLRVLNQAETDLLDWPDSDGKELLHLFRAQAAFFARDFDTALEAADDALAIDPNFVNAWIVKSQVFLDRAQLHYAQGRPLSAEERACTNTANLDAGSPTREAALRDARSAVDAADHAAELAVSSTWPFAAGFARMQQAHANRLLGQALIFESDLTNAAFALNRSEAQFTEALSIFSTGEYPQYVGWIQAGMGVARRLQAHIQIVERVDALNAGDEALAAAHLKDARTLLSKASQSFTACLDQRDVTIGNPVFQKRVLTCACEPYATEAISAMNSLEDSP
jgi:tetratricopeptide (TPR) repeat protein